MKEFDTYCKGFAKRIGHSGPSLIDVIDVLYLLPNILFISKDTCKGLGICFNDGVGGFIKFFLPSIGVLRNKKGVSYYFISFCLSLLHHESHICQLLSSSRSLFITKEGRYIWHDWYIHISHGTQNKLFKKYLVNVLLKIKQSKCQ